MDSKSWEGSESLAFSLLKQLIIKLKSYEIDSSLLSLQNFKIINIIGEQTRVEMPIKYHNQIGSNIFAFI